MKVKIFLLLLLFSYVLKAKEAYERATKRVQMETDRIEVLIEKREFSYG